LEGNEISVLDITGPSAIGGAKAVNARRAIVSFGAERFTVEGFQTSRPAEAGIW
jgi:hypothetical protein